MEVADVLRRLEIPFEYEAESFEWHEQIPNAYCGRCAYGTCFADRSYTPDFFLPEHDVIIEVKGIFTAKDRKIAQAMAKEHGHLNFAYLFYFDNKLSRKSKTRYTDWCARQGLECGVRGSMDKSIKAWCNL